MNGKEEKDEKQKFVFVKLLSLYINSSTNHS